MIEAGHGHGSTQSGAGSNSAKAPFLRACMGDTGITQGLLRGYLEGLSRGYIGDYLKLKGPSFSEGLCWGR